MSLKKNLNKARAERQERPSMKLFGDNTHSIPAVDTQGPKAANVRKAVKKIDPSRCRPWTHHDRNEWWLTPENAGGLVQSIKDHGQKQLGLVRPIANDPKCDYEIIFGVRRWYACQLAEIDFQAEVTHDDDATCARIMQDENALGEDISELEKCFAMANQLPLFENATELSRSLNLTKQIVGRRLAAARLKDHSEVMAILNPIITGVSLAKAKELIDFIESDSRNAKQVIKRASATVVPELQNSDLKESLDYAKQLAPKLIDALMKQDKRTSRPDNKRITTYLENTKGKPIVSLTDFGTGKVSLTLNTAQLKRLSDDVDNNKLLKNIMGDLKGYFDAE